MLTQSDLFGSGRLEGVRGGAVRSSERRAIASRVGRLASDVRWREAEDARMVRGGMRGGWWARDSCICAALAGLPLGKKMAPPPPPSLL
jgi:hypothetical protein